MAYLLSGIKCLDLMPFLVLTLYIDMLMLLIWSLLAGGKDTWLIHVWSYVDLALPKYDISLEALNNPLSLPKVLTSF